MKHDVIETFSRHREDIRRGDIGYALSFFGPVARGEERTDSDVDRFVEHVVRDMSDMVGCRA
jgi:predicted nucleotidyltransferase